MAKRLFRVWGGAGNRHGIQSHGDVLVNQLNDGTPLDELWVELTDVLDAYNKHRSTIASLVSYPTTNVADAVPQNVNAESFELATEYGVPQGISDPSYLKLAMNYRDYDLALRASWKYLRDATRDQWENRVTRAIEADNKLVNGLILQRLFSNVVYTNDFNLSCFGLWNGDGQVPPNHMGKTFDGNHTHYLTTLGTALTPLHVEAGIRHITEHGYAGAQAAKLLLLAHPDDIETSKLTSWRAGLEYASGSALPKFDFVPSSLAPAYL